MAVKDAVNRVRRETEQPLTGAVTGGRIAGLIWSSDSVDTSFVATDYPNPFAAAAPFRPRLRLTGPVRLSP